MRLEFFGQHGFPKCCFILVKTNKSRITMATLGEEVNVSVEGQHDGRALIDSENQ